MPFWKKKEAPPSPLMETEWRSIKWSDSNERKMMKGKLQKIEVCNPDVKFLRILVHGPVGAGKSSFINSIDSIFQDRMTCGAIAEKTTGYSCTKIYHTHKIKKDGKYEDHLSFVISDLMGLQKDSGGVHPQDLMKALEGHLRDGHKFNPANPCSENEATYNPCPSLGDRIHCLVSILPMDKVSIMGDEVFKQMKDVKEKANAMRIPQVAVMTNVDEACPEVKKDLKLIYKSKLIKKKMEECSNMLGVPLNCIFPVKNYHEEIELNDEVDLLLLSALSFILNIANDYVHHLKSGEN